MIKSPLRYPGGKSKAVRLIQSLFPGFEEYREPFLGGGSVYVHTKQSYPDKKFWINDLYADLYIFWKMAQEEMESLLLKVHEWRHQFQDGKELYHHLNAYFPHFNDLEKAAAFFIYNRITFSGTSLSGGYSQDAFDLRFTESSIHRLSDLSTVLDGNTIISRLDYKEVVTSPGRNVFIYLDPPYYTATKSALYGTKGSLHKAFDHVSFAETMRDCPHRWLITYDDCEYIRELFAFANLIPWDLKYGMRNVSSHADLTGKELFISNYVSRLP